MKLHKGVAYYPTYQAARAVLDAGIASGRFRTTVHKGCEYRPRLVAYGRGWAIQLRISGPYYPELDT